MQNCRKIVRTGSKVRVIKPFYWTVGESCFRKINRTKLSKTFEFAMFVKSCNNTSKNSSLNTPTHSHIECYFFAKMFIQYSHVFKVDSRMKHYPIIVPIQYSARNLEMSIRFSLKSRSSEQFHRAEMSQIKTEISLVPT